MPLRRGGEDAQRRLTELLHYAYGAASGAVYGCLAERAGGRAGAGTGTAYGLLVWAGSYLGWIPAVDILHPAIRHPRDRVAIMLAAHVVWGGGTGLLTRLLEEPRRPVRGRPRAANATSAATSLHRAPCRTARRHRLAGDQARVDDVMRGKENA
jgi:hypothetical protein